uniref:Ig-like domain-containing protein n=1 Tax=Cyprinodon variegatus TaxID=28743 RepID=A0A3Q2FTM3_CYPVA
MCFGLFTDVDAAKVLTQTPAFKTVSTGQQVVLGCNIQKPESYYVSWYKQVPGGTPQYVLAFYHAYSSPEFGAGFSSDRFNSKATSDIEYQFIIKQAKTGDTAVYYCRTWDDSVSEKNLICKSSDETAEDPQHDVSLWCKGLVLSNQTFHISSSLSIQTSDWNMNKVYTCKVSLGSQTAEKTINKSGCPAEEQ